MKVTMRRPLILGCLSVLAGASMVLAAEAEAYDVQTSNYENSMPQIDVNPEFTRDFHPDRTAYAGINQCETLIDENRVISVDYDMNLDLQGDTSLFGGLYYRDLERSEGSRVACRDSDGNVREDCVEIGSDDYTTEVGQVGVELSFEDLTGYDDVEICDEGEVDRHYIFQLVSRGRSQTTGDTTDWEQSEVRFVFDLIRPDAPTLQDAFATETTIEVEFEESETDDVETHHIFWSRDSFSAGDLPGDVNPDRTPRSVEGSESGSMSADLDAGETIYVGMTSRDRAGNFSPLTEPIELQVVETNSFWDFYVDAGGEEEGGYGCQKGGAMGTSLAMILAGLIGLGLVRRRRRPAVALATTAALAVVVMSPAVEANEKEEAAGMVQVGFGPYGPAIDDEFDGEGPYEAYFGDSSLRYLEVQADAHLWQRMGTLSLGFHGGYGRVSETARDNDGNRLDTDDTASFRIIPLKTSLVYRYDYSAHNHGIPLVPVAKAGLNYNFWRAKDTAGDTARVEDQRGSGGMFGWHAALGLHLHLNFFDPTNAASFDMTWGIHNSYVFFEYEWTRTGDFGDAALNLDANHWSVGLAFEF